mmetsp:Transcript_6847/g.17509  ORF Transcript_6847/g.17509 Transcript_6847/m.17509 type:complete len:474 (-) Transcript_6847:160-1581(-)
MVSARQNRSDRMIGQGSQVIGQMSHGTIPTTTKESEIEVEVRGSYLVILLAALIAGSVSFMGYVVSLAEFRPLQVPIASALMEILNNTTRTDDGTFEDLSTTPVSMRMKLLAAYVANDVEPERRLPVYGEWIAPATPDGNLTLEMHERRIYTNSECDPDGDGLIDDCDITSEWKYPNQVSGWLELADESATIADRLNPYRQYITPGAYRYVVIQTCLENADNVTYLAFRGATMADDFYFRLPRCFHLATPLPEVVEIADGDEVTFSLAYKLDGLMRTFSLDQIAALTEEWTCFVEEGAASGVCITLPAFISTYRRSIRYPVQLGNTTTEESVSATATAGNTAAEAEAFEKECSVKLSLAGSLRLCLWPSRFWNWVVMLAIVLVMSVLGIISITLKTSLEHLWQTGTAPTIGRWPLGRGKGSTRKSGSKHAAGNGGQTGGRLVRKRMGPDLAGGESAHSRRSAANSSAHSRRYG